MDCGKRKNDFAAQTTKSKVLKELRSMTTEDMRKLIKRTLAHDKLTLKGISKRTRSELCVTIQSKGLIIKTYLHGFLSNDGHNSCFLDSFLTSFLIIKRHKFIRDNYLNADIKHGSNPKLQQIAKDIQSELINIRNYLIKSPTAPTHISQSTLRQKFKEFEQLYKSTYNTKYQSVEWLHHQNDPSDVIDILNRVFNVKETIKTNTYPLAFNGIRIFVADRQDSDSVKLKDYVPMTKEYISDINKTIITEYKSADLLYIGVDRNYLNQHKSKCSVKPSMTITLPDNAKPLKLRALLIHIGDSVNSGHYVALLRIRNKWIYYDDMTTCYKLMSLRTRELFDHNGQYYLRNCAGFIYA